MASGLAHAFFHRVSGITLPPDDANLFSLQILACQDFEEEDFQIYQFNFDRVCDVDIRKIVRRSLALLRLVLPRYCQVALRRDLRSLRSRKLDFTVWRGVLVTRPEADTSWSYGAESMLK